MKLKCKFYSCVCVTLMGQQFLNFGQYWGEALQPPVAKWATIESLWANHQNTSIRSAEFYHWPARIQLFRELFLLFNLSGYVSAKSCSSRCLILSHSSWEVRFLLQEVNSGIMNIFLQFSIMLSDSNNNNVSWCMQFPARIMLSWLNCTGKWSGTIV